MPLVFLKIKSGLAALSDMHTCMPFMQSYTRRHVATLALVHILKVRFEHWI